MDSCHYKEVTNESEANISKTRIIQRKPFLRQLLVCSGGCTSMFLYGFCVGGPTVFIPQIRKEANSTNIITDDMASWLSSAYSVTTIPFVIIVSILAKVIGRKLAFLIGAVDQLAGFIVLYFSSNVTHILISQIMQGLFNATQLMVLVMIFTEYTSPRYRGLFLIMKTTAFYWGIWVANTIGTFLYWKKIPLIGMPCALYVVLTVTVWPKSPYWLASRGKFEECATAHRWLKGNGEESERELETLIDFQKKSIELNQIIPNSVRNYITSFWRTIKSEEFYKPSLISFTTMSLSVFCGKLLCIVYALDIIRKITNSESTAYIGMLILDGVTVISMILGCILATYSRRRTLLLTTSVIGVMFLFMLSLYLYLIELRIIIENKYVSLVLLAVFSISVSCGPLTMGHTFFGELIPIKSRSLSLCLICLTMKLIESALLKSGPLIFTKLGVHGLFLIFGICSTIVILILYKYLPETKDKTLQEIVDSFKRNTT